ncbi:uncharacterized protein LOC125941350 [Dermacentor silvarum]|uniref:uncharacterized protein LOC125941350 n=1 Tax=Dermacentor silvarum TaxID=543639 RepID=UPI002100C209|nr:uncharacterized protein LOC125941350 [Dermacentor silvarum]
MVQPAGGDAAASDLASSLLPDLREVLDLVEERRVLTCDFGTSVAGFERSSSGDDNPLFTKPSAAEAFVVPLASIVEPETYDADILHAESVIVERVWLTRCPKLVVHVS